MKKLRPLSLLILVLLSNIVMAQSIRVLPVSTDIIGNNAAEMLYNRLNQAVSLNGMASTDNSNKFLLIPSVTVMSVEPTTTVPNIKPPFCAKKNAEGNPRIILVSIENRIKVRWS